jgi:hypothetical protein
MKLPKIEQPIITIVQPSTKKKVKFRPFLVKEEKILLMAQQAGRRDEIIHAIFQVLNNCLIDELDLRETTTFDFDFFFLKLRAASVDNMISLTYTDPNDAEKYPVSVNLDKVKLVVSDPDQKIKVDDLTIALKYPTIGSFLDIADKIIDDVTDQDQILDFADEMLASCIRTVYDSETVYDEFTNEELAKWIETLPPHVFRSIKEFLDSVPEISHTAEIKRKDGTTTEVVLRGLEDFFTLP